MLRAMFALLSILPLASPAVAGADKEEPTVRGKKAPEWLEILQKDPKAERRQAAVIALGILGPKLPGVVLGLSDALKDSDSAVRRTTAQTLGQLGAEGRRAVDPLAETVKTDKSEAVRQAAATALGRLGATAKGAVPELSQALEDSHSGTRAAAAEALGRIGPDAVAALPNLVRLLKDSERLARAQAAFALGRFGLEAAPAVPALATVVLNDSQVEIRRLAAEALGQIGPEASGAAAESLGQALQKDTQAEVRRAAALALGKIGTEAKSALPALLGALKDGDKFVRALALHTVAALAEESPLVVPAMATCLADEVAEVRLAAVDELGRLGPLAKPALAALRGVQKNDGRSIIRDAAAD